MGGTGNDGVQGIAVDRSGNVFVTGYFQNSVDFGSGTPLNSAGLMDIFIAKYSASNGFLWAKRFGSPGDDAGYGVAVDGNGDVLVTGMFNGSINFGGTTLNTYGGGHGMFVAKFSGATGTHVWSKNLQSYSASVGMGVAVDGAGNALVTGDHLASVIFRGVTYPNAGYAEDIFLAKYAAADGAEMWFKHFGGPNTDIGTGIAVDLRCVGGSNATGVAVDSAGDVVVTGNFDQAIDFGGGALASAGSGDIFVTKLSGASGAQVWARGYGAAGNESGNAVAIDGNRNVVACGWFGGTVNFGGAALTSAGSGDIFVIGLTP